MAEHSNLIRREPCISSTFGLAKLFFANTNLSQFSVDQILSIVKLIFDEPDQPL